jgi:lysophospholipase L1-like esterase
VAFNPYLRASTGGDNPDHVFNGQIFDFDHYLTRFSFADPDYVVINLGTNDLLQQTVAEAVAQVQRGLAVMVSSIRAAAPSAKIGIVINGDAASVAGNTRWTSGRSQVIRAMIGFVRTLADANVEIVPVYLHQSIEDGWPRSVSATDAATGRQTAAISDNVHLSGLGVAQYAEGVGAWIATHEAQV